MLLPLGLLVFTLPFVFTQTQDAESLFEIRGQIAFRGQMTPPKNWKTNSKVIVNYGEYIGFVKDDSTFLIEGVPSGSYIIEISNIDYIFEPVRYEINSKGKARARLLNLLQPNNVEPLPVPLVINARQPTRYFRAREEWRITDVLMNPMILMLVVAMFFMFVTPRLAAQDPELQKEMDKIKMPTTAQLPDMADMLANMFGGGSAKKPATKKITNKPR